MLLHDVTRCFRRVFKNPIQYFCFNTLLLDAKETENMKKQKKAKKLHPCLGGLKSGQEVVPLFPQKCFFVPQNPQNPFYSVSRKVGGGHFLQKRPMLKGGYFRGTKMITFGCLLERTL